MSKSVGNVVDPLALAESFGVDALRYFLMREVTFGQDGSYSAEAIVNRVNAELANSFGNLAQRTLSMIFKNLDGVLPAAGEAAEDRDLLDEGRRPPVRISTHASANMPSRRGSKRGWRLCSLATPMSTLRHPGRCARPIPSAWRPSWARLSSAVRQLNGAVAPVIPESADKLLTPDRQREGRAAHRPAAASLPAARAGGETAEAAK